MTAYTFSYELEGKSRTISFRRATDIAAWRSMIAFAEDQGVHDTTVKLTATAPIRRMRK